MYESWRPKQKGTNCSAEFPIKELFGQNKLNTDMPMVNQMVDDGSIVIHPKIGVEKLGWVNSSKGFKNYFSK